MISALSSLTFAYPWVLFLLITLPLFYWLIRVTPPKPKIITFSAVQFLLGLSDRQETTISTPWWLLILRLLIAGLVILAIAQPRLYPNTPLDGSGPITILLDNDWASAPHWTAIEQKTKEIVTKADADGRLVNLIPLAGWPTKKPAKSNPEPPKELLESLGLIQPVAWNLSETRLEDIFQNISDNRNGSFHLLTDGTLTGIDPERFRKFLHDVELRGSLSVYKPETIENIPLIGPPRYENGGLLIPLTRVNADQAQSESLLIKSIEGHILTQQEPFFSAGERETQVSLKLPGSVLNKIKSLQIAGKNSAGSLYLMDTRNQRKNVGLVSSDQFDPTQALLSEQHYLSKALAPFYNVKTGEIDDLLTKDTALIFMGDTGNLLEETELKIFQWVESGGVLVRFAGVKLANAKTSLTPVPLRQGSRNLDGSISWTTPAKLGDFSKESPFSGLAPTSEITVNKQILAIPSPDLANSTWASLSDGTPLVTGKRFTDGHIVLFHTTATPSWSNLAISGLFVEMLREIGQLGHYAKNAETMNTRMLPPYQLMDGFGYFNSAMSEASPIEPAATSTAVSQNTPAGYYGDATLHVALNIGDSAFPYEVINLDSVNATVSSITVGKEIDLRRNLLLIILLLAVFDLCVLLYFKGVFEPFRRPNTSLSASFLVISIFLFFFTSASLAEENVERLLDATLDTRLAFVLTGDPEVDKITAAGLAGLSQTLLRRTSVETAPPMQVDPEKHELLFYPFVYWPVTADFPELSSRAISRINRYLKEGGTIVFDTRNQHKVGRYGGNISNSPENIRLQKIVSKLQIPLLQIVPVDHVLTRSFYLMQSFPGRYESGNVWVSLTSEGDGNDGVSSVIIGSNDWAAAWAIDEQGRAMVSVIPGNERQREQARRFGVNLAMYTLTGSYKADQVHIPTILNRLSQ
ncbi:DUF4159 domain-containing protein [Sneathiella glossodoripedis]|uniref:DUF4159 domain-containing protein n=1 Tax=Sneathiella glossodoripedis TaxID=418853 RepID=UPI0004726F27|nr:DUF4159 domain-containing protein [Sneathiella glossodoripedis]